MQANLYATFRLLAHTKTLTVPLTAGSTVMQAVEAVISELPVLRSHWLDQDGSLHAHVHVFVNGNDVATLEQGMETPLQSTDVLDFFPPVAGGYGFAG